MDEPRILSRIEELVQEEHRLYERDEEVGLTDAERERLAALRAQLDTCWNVLQARRGRWEAGLDPGGADETR